MLERHRIRAETDNKPTRRTRPANYTTMSITIAALEDLRIKAEHMSGHLGRRVTLSEAIQFGKCGWCS